MERAPHIAVCAPLERTLFPVYVQRRNQMLGFAQSYGIQSTIWEEQGIYIGRQRTNLTKRILSVPEYTHALFLDNDSCPPLQGLVALFEWALPIVSGLYFMRSAVGDPVAYRRCPDWDGTSEPPALKSPEGYYETVRAEVADFLEEQRVPWAWQPVMVGAIGQPRPRPIEVDVVGGGFLLVQREVLEACPTWKTEEVGEDVAWCIAARQAGYRIHLDLGVIVAHLETLPLSTAWFAGAGRKK